MGHHKSIRLVAAWMILSAAVCSDARAVDDVEIAGNILLIAMPAAAVGMTVRFSDETGVLQFGKSAALTIGATYGLKWTVTAERPDGGNESFPSGHTSISFCSAEFIRKRYGWKYGLPSYALALFVAYSRVESRRHYPRDVAAGAVIGIASSYIFTEPRAGWHIEPQVDANYYGLRLARYW